ncbi:hypothetical protein [Serratia entomophila]|uniref:hypothetical protein n=1 Tax=Serratia entomophila TaxID=42906 RepID=UPI00217746D5|nr:hypothetical protein [Serratia entomophila]CAI0721680.1 Uncharacterised protein [Serratia entomophila]CAI0721913.1 Uncharacterised protein [Serratia entomophila]CAI0723251.1 Uncharacterised protein [Serratia entomophila]CAI0857506.1 Uncharacterised protein [Serratia entomophila]CAI1549950.1 Uncharacterised protein [Serratia entomophila]
MTASNNWKKFSSDTTRALFVAVEEDDLVEANISLPQQIDLHCSLEHIRDNYALCLQFWEDGFSRRELLQLVNAFLQDPQLAAATRMRYKYIRARYKHFRFAQQLYGERHRANRLFHTTTVVLGHFQDAFRNGNRKNLKLYGNLLRVLLSRPVWSCVRYALRHIHLASERDFIAYRQAQMRLLQTLIASPELTGRQFHDVRKIVSRQVSFYDTLRSIDPDNREARQVSRFLAAINGLMGDRHDVMVADKLAGGDVYDRPGMLDIDIRQRLELLLARFPL